MTMTAEKTRQKNRFTNYPAYHKLLKLAESPFDLTAPNALSNERIQNYQANACGFKFLYGTERVDGAVLEAFQELIEEAEVHKKMEAQQNGEVVNLINRFASDNRRVLHTAMRDFFENPNTNPAAREATSKAKQQHERLKAFIEEIDRENRFTHLVTVAIGGSDLGPRALCLSLRPYLKKGRKLHFISNVDPDDTAQVLNEIDPEKTLVVVVSKSGTTTETVTNETILRNAFKAKGLDPKNHFVSVTEEGSPMDNTSHYLNCFQIWDYVGGRFSGTSLCGCITLAFAFGHENMMEVLRGANAMDKTALEKDLSKNLPLMGALLAIWNRNFLNYPTIAFVPYAEALFRFPAHIQQVEMESNGKRIDRDGNKTTFETGPIIWGEPGTNAQHSFYQLIHQGTATVPLELVGFAESQRGVDEEIQGTTSQEKLLSNLFAQAIALAQGQKNSNPNKVFPGNRPSHILLAKKLTPYTMGALFAYVEHKVAFEGYVWDINSFDQEGVQLGKVLANEITELFAEQRGKSSKVDFPEGRAFIEQLNQVKSSS